MNISFELVDGDDSLLGDLELDINIIALNELVGTKEMYSSCLFSYNISQVLSEDFIAYMSAMGYEYVGIGEADVDTPANWDLIANRYTNGDLRIDVRVFRVDGYCECIYQGDATVTV